MSLKKKLLIAGLALPLLYAAYEYADGWRVAHPRIDWVKDEAATFTALVPSRWKLKTEGGTSVSLGEERGLFQLNIGDETASGKTVDELVREGRSGGESASDVKAITLDNGVQARTWTDIMSMVEVGVEVRHYVFKAPNGRTYYAMHWLPPNWKGAWFYERVYRRVLGSMEFKAAAEPTKKRG